MLEVRKSLNTVISFIILATSVDSTLLSRRSSKSPVKHGRSTRSQTKSILLPHFFNVISHLYRLSASQSEKQTTRRRNSASVEKKTRGRKAAASSSPRKLKESKVRKAEEEAEGQPPPKVNLMLPAHYLPYRNRKLVTLCESLHPPGAEEEEEEKEEGVVVVEEEVVHAVPLQLKKIRLLPLLLKMVKVREGGGEEEEKEEEVEEAKDAEKQLSKEKITRIYEKKMDSMWILMRLHRTNLFSLIS